MATVNQIYLMVNDATKEALGSKAIAVKDTSTLVSLGDLVLSSDKNKEAFYNALVDRIGRTVIAIRKFKSTNRSIKRDEMNWGIIYQKISYKLHSAVNNGTWETETQVNPFDVEIQTEAVQKLFSKIGTWSYEDSIPDRQLFTAFQNAAAMGAFIDGIFINMDNAMTIAEDSLADLAASTCIAGTLIKGKATQKRNLLSEYNAKYSQTLTVSAALTNADFLKFASYEINQAVKHLKRPNTVYNAEGIPRQTTSEKMVVEILDQFASATASYLESGTYHKELVALPGYEEISFWQASGEDFSFANCSTVNITNSELSTVGNETGTIEQSGIVAFIHDYDAVASCIYNVRTSTKYNPRAERMNIFKKADKGYAVDLSENSVVFYIA